MTTNSEISSFLKKDQEARAREKEQEKIVRAQERKEDREHILGMIQKVVDKEIKAAIGPVESKLEIQERVNKELFNKLNILTKEMNHLKQELKSQQQAFPLLPEPQVQQGHQEHVRLEQNVQSDKPLSEIDGLCAAARKVVGFSPIEPRMLDIQIQSYGAKNMEEAKLMEIKSYLKCEMKILPSVIEQLTFFRIFPPAKDDWRVLYVEFGSDKEVDLVFSHTRAIHKNDHRVIRWIPKQMFERFKAIQALAYKIRKEEGLKTRVKIGTSDFLLSTRTPTSPVWHFRKLPDNLPTINMDEFQSSSTSPAPGRPRSLSTCTASSTLASPPPGRPSSLSIVMASSPTFDSAATTLSSRT